jgi:hypothetical protein
VPRLPRSGLPDRWCAGIHSPGRPVVLAGTVYHRCVDHQHAAGLDRGTDDATADAAAAHRTDNQRANDHPAAYDTAVHDTAAYDTAAHDTAAQRPDDPAAHRATHHTDTLRG